MTNKTNDNRLSGAYHAWLARRREEDAPQLDASAAHSGFISGWHARFDAARAEHLGDGAGGGELDIIKDQFALLSREYHRAFEQVFKANRHTDLYRDLATRLRAQVEEMKANPDDAPAYKRIGMQRREIRRLNQEIKVLRGTIAQLEETR